MGSSDAPFAARPRRFPAMPARLLAGALLALAASGVAAKWGHPEETVVADRVLIVKSKRSMKLLANGKVLKAYRISLGRTPLGHKQCEGDNRTPEGLYTVIEHKGDSAYHLALRLSYPGPDDMAAAAAKGCSPGGNIMIHGLGTESWIRRAHLQRDWTRGCIALTNEEIEEVWELVPNGTIVEIRS